MRVGSLVRLDSNLYSDIYQRIGIIVRVLDRDRMEVRWNDNTKMIITTFDLEVLCE